MRQQSRVREQVELEKTTIRNLKAWDPSMNLASYIQEFEDCMCRGKIHKDKWCNIITSQFKGQVWQDWIDHKELGDEDGYENAKEMVLEMHGVSLLQSPQQHNQQRQYPQQQQPVVGRDDRPSYQPRCFICNDPGHKAGACPNKGKGYSNQLYSQKPVRRLGKSKPGAKKVPNIVEGVVNGHTTYFLLDTGADITVINKQFIKGEQLTGELVTLEGIGGTEFTYPTAVLEVTAGDMIIPIVAAVVDIGNTTDGGLLGNDIEHETFITLLKQASFKKLHADNVIHVKMTRAEKQMEQQENERIEKQEQLDQACPKPLESFDNVPEVEDSDEESVVEDLVDESVGLDSVAESREVVELRSNVEEEIGEDTGRIALSMEEACNVGSQFSDAVELSLAGLEAPGQPVPSTLRAEFEKETQTDDSLKAWREIATKREKGFSWDGPLIRKETEGPAGETRSLIAVPLRMRKSIMSMAHNNFGHMSDKRTRYIVGRKFVWPGMARDVSRWCKTCVIC